MKYKIDDFLKTNKLKVNSQHPEARLWASGVDPSSPTFLDELATALARYWLIDDDGKSEQNVNEEEKDKTPKKKFTFDFKSQFLLTFVIFVYIIVIIYLSGP